MYYVFTYALINQYHKLIDIKATSCNLSKIIPTIFEITYFVN